MDALEKRLHGAAVIDHEHPMDLSGGWRSGAYRGKTATITWQVLHASAEGVTIEMPEVPGLTFTPSVLKVAPGRRDYSLAVKVAVAADAPVGTVAVVPLVKGWGVELLGYGVLFDVLG